MYKDTKISLEVYDKYYELVGLLKQKGCSSSKLNKLEILLNYFINNFESFNNEEKKLIKNVIMIADAITEKANTYYEFVERQKSRCINQVKVLNAKRKEPNK